MSGKGHSSYLSWRIIKNRAIEHIIPTLGKQSRAQMVFSVLLTILALLSLTGLGIYVDGYGIHPPAQFTGICPAPAVISHNGQNCTITQYTTTVSGTETKTVTSQINAGTILTNTTRTITTTVIK